MSAHAHALPIMTCICTRWAGGPGSVFTCMSREVYVNHDYVLVYKPAFLRYITAKKAWISILCLEHQEMCHFSIPFLNLSWHCMEI